MNTIKKSVKISLDFIVELPEDYKASTEEILEYVRYMMQEDGLSESINEDNLVSITDIAV